jgi:hypothetical protein
MRSYELIFEVGPVTDELADRLLDDFDAVVGEHGSVTLLSLACDGVSGEAAARTMAAKLSLLGVKVDRLSEDLVTRATIAARAGVTPQAVGQWIRGERLASGSDFPRPFNQVAGGVWLWSEVNAWLEQHGMSDGLAHPDRIDYIHANQALAARHCIEATATIATVRTAPVLPQFNFSVWEPTQAGQYLVNTRIDS